MNTYVVLNLSFVPNTFLILIENIEVKEGSLPETIGNGIPCSQTIFLTYVFASFKRVSAFLVGKKQATLVNRSIMTQMVSCSDCILDKLIKSIVT